MMRKNINTIRKHLVPMAVAVAMIAGLNGCSKPAESETTAAVQETQEAQGTYTPGTYTAEAQGRNGMVKVEVEFDDEKIVSVNVVEHQETPGICEGAIERIPADIVTYQSLAVDAVSGATLTSDAILNAVADCVTQAGGDAEALSNVAISKEASNEVVELTADVVVVGGGGAGMTAACAAAEQGASVILVEKMSSLGGNTIRSGAAMNCADPELDALTPTANGQLETLSAMLDEDEADYGDYADTLRVLKDQIREYLAGDTTHEFDSVEWHMIQTYKESIRTDKDGNTCSAGFDLVKVMCSETYDTYKWMSDTLDIPFYTDRLTSPAGSLWWRGHAAVSNADIFSNTTKFLEDRGGKIYLDTKADELLTDNGKVIGVSATCADGSTMKITANSGVVLACGGFGNNPEMVQKYNTYWPNIPDGITSTNAPGNTGDGIVMATEVGADLTGMGFVQMIPAFDILVPAENFIYVNSDAERYVNEYSTRDVLSAATLEQTGSVWALFDSAQAATNNASLSLEEIDKTYVETGRVLQAETLDELAELMGVDASALKETVEKYNSFVDTGVDTDLGKQTFGLKIQEGPFYASPVKVQVHHTMGGVTINTDTQVLDASGNVIPGLYAAGEVTGGIHGGNRVGGNALADCFTFGRIAGTNAAKH